MDVGGGVARASAVVASFGFAPQISTMPLLLDKIIGLLLLPLGLAMAALLAGLVALAWRRRRTAFALIGLAAVWLWVWSMPLVPTAMSRALAAPYPPLPAEALPTADAIVLLGGGIMPTRSGHPYPNLGSAADRIWHAARLYHAGKAPVILATAGSVWGDAAWGKPDNQTGAEAMRMALVSWNVPRSVVIIEPNSRSTRENAVETAALAARHGFEELLLVTSASHMRRAEAAFRRVGLSVTPAACDHGGELARPAVLLLIPTAGALSASSSLLREQIGWLAYRLRGWA